jgi:hypothetical protein
VSAMAVEEFSKMVGGPTAEACVIGNVELFLVASLLAVAVGFPPCQSLVRGRLGGRRYMMVLLPPSILSTVALSL